MSRNRSVLMLELNELSLPLIERFRGAGDLPGFSRLYDESSTWVTDACEPQSRLNPWVQWVTAHTGVGFDEHQICKLGEGHRLAQPTIADVVVSSGAKVWLCGSMNVVPTRPVEGAWLPDPWNPDPQPVPAGLEPFARFVRANVQEHTNPTQRLGARDVASFARFMLGHGLSRGTTGAVAGQLVGERTGRRRRFERAALLDRVQWDVFAWHARRMLPAFSTFFSNTTAHYQHLYWRHMDPHAFTLQPDPQERPIFGEAIGFGYREMDRLVSQAMTLADRLGSVLVFCTAISQQPYLAAEEGSGSRFYRPHEIAAFVATLGLSGVTRVAPVMAAQFHVLFTSVADAEAAEASLRDATLDGRTAFDLRRVDRDLFMGCAVVDDVSDAATLEVPATGVSLPFHQHFYRSETAKSGYHHPNGSLWIRRGKDDATHHAEPVPLTAVAPTLLSLIGLDSPETMRAAALPV